MEVAAIVTAVLEAIQSANKYAPIVIDGISNAKPFAMELYRKITGQEPDANAEAIIDAKLAELSARLAEPLPPAQPGDPDFK